MTDGASGPDQVNVTLTGPGADDGPLIFDSLQDARRHAALYWRDGSPVPDSGDMDDFGEDDSDEAGLE